MTSLQFCQRADLIGTQIITRDTGKRMGVVSQLWVDVDRREVVALGFRESMLSGVVSNTQQTMLLSSVRQIGDVLLVDDDDVVEEDLDLEGYSKLVNSEVITETGEVLGKVRGFKFDTTNGAVVSIVVATFGLPQIPDQLISTYELSMDEVVSSGPDRLIVFEGAEEKLSQLTVGLLERLGIGKAPWERDEDEDYMVPTATSNQLGTGLKTPVEPIRTVAPARETWDEDNWSEADTPQREAFAADEPEYEPVEVYQPERKPQYAMEYDDLTQDAWGDDENPKPDYDPQEVNIPERKRVVEYEEEPDY